MYYRIGLVDELLAVIEDFDYSYQDRSTMLREPGSEYIMRFDTEKEAKKYLNSYIKEEYIHPNWKGTEFDQSKYFK